MTSNHWKIEKKDETTGLTTFCPLPVLLFLTANCVIRQYNACVLLCCCSRASNKWLVCFCCWLVLFSFLLSMYSPYVVLVQAQKYVFSTDFTFCHLILQPMFAHYITQQATTWQKCTAIHCSAFGNLLSEMFLSKQHTCVITKQATFLRNIMMHQTIFKLRLFQQYDTKMTAAVKFFLK